MGYLSVMDFGFGDAIVMYTARYKAQGKIDKEKNYMECFGLYLM